MAKHVILESYAFTPATRTIVVTGKNIRQEQLLLITNTTRGVVIYNFSDPTLLATSYSVPTMTGPVPSATEQTTIVLAYNTTAHLSTDKLAILVEETYTEIVPSETTLDLVGKLRVSQPQSLIDTDFEYGTQPTKWESISLAGNRPSAYYDATTPISVANVVGNASGSAASTITVTFGVATGAIASTATLFTVTHAANAATGALAQFATGSLVTISGVTPVAYNGTWLVASSVLGSFTVASTGNFGAQTVAGLVAYQTTSALYAGQPVFLTQSTRTDLADGWWVIDAVTYNASCTLVATGSTFTTAQALFDVSKTTLFAGTWYTGAGIPLTTVSGSGSVITVTSQNAHGLQVGNGVHVTGVTTTTAYNGTFQIATTPTTNTFTVTSTVSGTATLAGTTQATTAVTSTVSTFTVTHAVGTWPVFPVGSWVTIAGVTPVAYNLTWQVVASSSGSFTVASSGNFGTQTVAGTVAPVQAWLYPKTVGYVTHRAFDGGVQFSNQSSYHGYQVIRQSRRYFRYQSGKAMQFSTGTALKPIFATDTITSSSTTVTVTTKFPHGLVTGASVSVAGCNETAFNGTFTVTASTYLTFTYTALTTPSATPATAIQSTNMFAVGPASWYGGRNRVGMFDEQNGLFFEFDGVTLWAVRRHSVTQISGACACVQGQATITGTQTAFADQLKPGDRVVIKGLSYQVQSIQSQTAMVIQPEYRGPSTTAAQVSKTIDVRVAQSAFNIDRADGTGASGFTFDLSKMQMFYIDYSWYGAGAIRFGAKNNRGEVIYLHRMVNNNQRTESYMRSGNLPARYETNTLTMVTYLTATLASGTASGTVQVNDASLWPTAGTVMLTSAASPGAVEYLAYTAKSGSAGAYLLTFASRAATGGSATAQQFTYSVTAPIKAELVSPLQASTLSHWGSSVIMDGRYDDDKSLVFSAGMTAAQQLSNLPLAVRIPLISVRVAPSVDSGYTGLLGQREIVNRMQMILRQMDSYTTAAFRVELILNGITSSGSWTPVGGSSLGQYIIHPANSAITGGENIFSFFTTASGVTQQDLTLVRDMGNAILSGGPLAAVASNTTGTATQAATTQTLVGTSTTLAPSMVGSHLFYVNAPATYGGVITAVASLTGATLSQIQTVASSLGVTIVPPQQRYPDGPDIVTLCATAISSATNVINARISWTEAQA